MDFCFKDVAPHLHTNPPQCVQGITRIFVGEAQPLRAAQFSFSALTSFGRVYVFYSVMRQQVPKPTFVFEVEGELYATIVNGDRLAWLAL